MARLTADVDCSDARGSRDECFTRGSSFNDGAEQVTLPRAGPSTVVHVLALRRRGDVCGVGWVGVSGREVG